MSSLESEGSSDISGPVQTWSVMIPLAVNPDDPLYLPGILQAKARCEAAPLNNPEAAYPAAGAWWTGWHGPVYEDHQSGNALNERWLQGWFDTAVAERAGDRVRLQAERITEAEAEIARWYYDGLYGLRIGACDPGDALCELMESFRWSSPIMRLVAEFQFRRRDGRLLPSDIERMLAFRVNRRTIIRWMDRYAVPR